MNKFIKKCILFCILSSIITYCTDLILSKLIQPNGYMTGWQDLYANNINADLLIFGSSRAQKSFNPKIIEDSLSISCYNLGLINARMQIDYLRLLEYLRVCSKKPKYVTLEIDFFTFGMQQSLSNHWQLFPYMLYNNNHYHCTNFMTGFSYIDYFVPLVRYSGYSSTIIKNSILEDKQFYKGFIPIDTYMTKDIVEQQKSFWKEEIQADSIKINYLYEFINTCKSYGIKLNFVFIPQFQDVEKGLIGCDSITNFIKKIATLNNIPFGDFSIPYFNNDTIYFYDMRHLNSRGANKFTSEYYVPWIKQIYGL